MEVKCNAKINLSLDVLNTKKPEGFHNLDMINLPISLYDTLDIKITEDGNDIILHSNNEKIPTDRRNVVYKVIEKYKELFNIKFSIDVNIIKNIPTEAGLGGGSSDASCMLNYLDKKFSTNMSLEDKISFMTPITSDGPFFLINKPARIQNTGEIVTPIISNFDSKILLVKPNSGCSTKEIYNSLQYDKLEHPNTKMIMEGLINNNLSLIKDGSKNSLQKAAMAKNAEISDILSKLDKCGFEIISLSGSGSTCFAISNKEEPYNKANLLFNKENYELFKIVKINQ